MPLTDAQVAQAVLLTDQGRTQRDVAAILNVPRTTLRFALKRYRETGLYTRRPGSGRVRCTSARDDRFLILEVLRNRFLTAVEIKRRLQATRGIIVSERTIRRRLEERDLRAKRPARGPELERHHRVARLRFAREHVNWTTEQWSKVLFTDECRVALRAPDGRERVYRRRGERFLSITTRQTVSYQGGSVMVWGGVCSEARTELVIVDRRLTAAMYIEEILQDHVVPFVDFIGREDFLLMQDNARAHTAGIVESYLTDVGVQKLPWPARSPDMNPIEHVWDMLKRRVRALPNPPETLRELKTVLVMVWEEISQIEIKNILQSMPDRMQAVINARGSNTRY